MPPALLTRCEILNQPPDPLVDPARLAWEAAVVGQYEACRQGRDRLVEAVRALYEGLGRGL
ncbi:hypothetical protein UFOVP119_92 [uncultured Caudovirales phage]|uniref:Uncharacterized protein n=1 Tax=uncultured Caudovirales phage TaxID=2100421 RepID=A0A6J5L7A9_9CAUD|nr:hypothetical protein UFOVP119_92 [uncultured Caudovirales phage]